jgi:hypothetical protein
MMEDLRGIGFGLVCILGTFAVLMAPALTVVLLGIGPW